MAAGSPARTCKHDLPNYGVFDEKRVFAAGPAARAADRARRAARRAGVRGYLDRRMSRACLAETGAEILLVPNGSPFEAGKEDVRLALAAARVRETGLPLVYLNQVGGQDELVFDGASFVLNADGAIAAGAAGLGGARRRSPNGRATRTANGSARRANESARKSRASQVYHAMMLGLRDYVNKNRFPGVVLGLSGGIDSALSAAVAVDALGAARVRCVMLPSRYTSRDSLEDADACARLLGVPYETIEIERAVAAMGETLAPAFAGTKRRHHRREYPVAHARRDPDGDLQQVRAHGADHRQQERDERRLCHALWRHVRRLQCAEGHLQDRSLRAVALAQPRHSPAGALGPRGRVIPERIIDKPPTAELRANQTDQDSLPPYDMLDGILECLVEKEMSFDETVAQGLRSRHGQAGRAACCMSPNTSAARRRRA